jgi:hypothetical protein
LVSGISIGTSEGGSLDDIYTRHGSRTHGEIRDIKNIIDIRGLQMISECEERLVMLD